MRALLRTQCDDTLLAFEFDQISYDKNTHTLSLFNYDGAYNIEDINADDATRRILDAYTDGRVDLSAHRAIWEDRDTPFQPNGCDNDDD